MKQRVGNNRHDLAVHKNSWKQARDQDGDQWNSCVLNSKNFYKSVQITDTGMSRILQFFITINDITPITPKFFENWYFFFVKILQKVWFRTNLK